MPQKHFDNLVIGAGPAGYQAALRLAGYGQSVGLVDASEDAIGGACLNEGCIPVKSLAQAAEVYSTVARSQEFGVSCGAFSVDLPAIAARSEKNKTTLRNGILSLLKNAKVGFIRGSASFEDAHTVRVTGPQGSEFFTADRFLVAAGSVPKTVPGLETDGRIVLNSRDMLALGTVPKKLLVVGAGAIGCEFASIFRQLGASVTLLEILPQILPGEDDEVSRTLAREFQKISMEVLTGAKVLKLTPQGDGAQAVFVADGEERSARYDRVLIAAGRKPRTGDLGLDRIGLTLENGFIPVDSEMRTAVRHIFAAGDVTEKTAAYAHTAARGGLIAADAMAGKKPSARLSRPHIPRIVFTEPQVASVGLTEAQCRETGQPVTSFKRFFKACGRAVISGHTAGFFKITADPGTGKILGAVIVGPQATELIHEIGLAADAGLSLSDLGRFTHGHPTLSEIAGEIAGDPATGTAGLRTHESR